MQQIRRTSTLDTTILDASSQRVQLFISARNLLDLDFFSKSDPYVKVYFQISPDRNQKFLGKTETIDNNLNPNFNKTFILDYIFEARQALRFQVYDEDDGNNDDFIGSVTTSLGALAGAKSQTLILDLTNKNSNKKPGKLILRLEPCQQSNLLLSMKWRARKLMNTDSFFDFWDKSDPYLKFLKIRRDNTLVQAARTEVIMDNLNPNWRPVQIQKNRLITGGIKQKQNCEIDVERFKVQCWDWEQAGQAKHQYIGETVIDLQRLKSTKAFPIQFPLSNMKHKKPGILVLQQIKQIYKPTFLDYIRGGLELNLSVAIDFTGSNGIPTQPSSLHHINPMKPNQYQMAIDAVSRILLNYDSDKKIPAFGFGAKTSFSRTVSHCFPLSLDNRQLEAFGLQHLMAMYCKALVSVQLSGPTYFAPIISETIKLAKLNALQGSNTYQILLILTDGEIHDMKQTVDLLVKNCNLPLSIIIVGIGNADFSNMQRLDGDEGLYNQKGTKAARDIVQFVPFRQVRMNSDLLAKQLLAELPTQLTSYMALIGKAPNPPVQINLQQMLQSGNKVSPQQALQQQVVNLFKQSNFFSGY